MELLNLDEYDHIIVSFSGGKDSLATLLCLMAGRGVSPSRMDGEGFGRLDGYEQRFVRTIHRSLGVVQRAERGRSTLSADRRHLRALAMGREYPRDLIDVGDAWRLPAGAYRKGGGPT